MKPLHLISIVALFGATMVCAQESVIRAEQFGALIQQTKPVKTVSHYSGSQLMATVAVLPGQSFVIRAPMSAQQVIYLKASGESISAGEPYAQLIGPEVHHYFAQYQIKQRIHAQAESLYHHNKTLFEKRSLSEASWLAVSQQYYAAKLEYDEFTHFFEFVDSFDEQAESLLLTAPRAGIVIYDQVASIETNQTIASFAPSSAIRLKVNIPSNISARPTLLQAGHCTLPVDKVAPYNNGFYKTIWSVPLEASCKLDLGEVTGVVPQYSVDAFSVDKSSVFNWQGRPHVLVLEQLNYRAVAIELIGSAQQDYIVQADSLLAEQQVLVTSVSAAQGILMGLGE